MRGNVASDFSSESCFEAIVLKKSRRIARLSASRPANGSLKIKSCFFERRARARRVRRISLVDIYFNPRSRIFSTPHSFISGKDSSRLAVSGSSAPFFIGPVSASAIKMRPVRPMSTPPSMYSLSSRSRSS